MTLNINVSDNIHMSIILNLFFFTHGCPPEKYLAVKLALCSTTESDYSTFYVFFNSFLRIYKICIEVIMKKHNITRKVVTVRIE